MCTLLIQDIVAAVFDIILSFFCGVSAVANNISVDIWSTCIAS